MRITKRLAIILSTFTLVFAGLAMTASAQERNGRHKQRPLVVRYYWTPDPFWHSRWYDPFYDDRFYSYDPYLEYRRERFKKQEKVGEEAEELQKERRKARADGVITAKEREDINEERQEYLEALQDLEDFYAKHRYIDVNG